MSSIKFYEEGRKTFEFQDSSPERVIKNGFSVLKKKFGIW